METSPETAQVIKVEQVDNSAVELNIDDNIIVVNNADIEEGGEILAINNENIQFEYFDVKNLDQNEIVVKNSQNSEEEIRVLRKEYSLLSEKFQLMHSQVQNQSKMIEYLIRRDMINSTENLDKKELDDLHRKISICSIIIEECQIKYNELCNEKRRVLLATTNEPEKKAAVWDHFTVISDADGNRNAECNYCGRCFNYKNLTANKCKEHIFERCDKAPEAIRITNKVRNDPQQKSKYVVWNYFLQAEKNGKTVVSCIFCGLDYSSRNATKCREHLAFKCNKADPAVREQMKSSYSQEYINSFNTSKRSTIWEHFNIIVDDDKEVIQCIYCCMNYANKNATKCREHLLERCDQIPIAIRHRISNSFFDSPLKTWTQIKVPIWNHFSIITIKERMDLPERKQYKCNYCEKLYCSKNVTKFRLHLLSKCQQISEETKELINCEITRLSVKNDDSNTDSLYPEFNAGESLQDGNEDQEMEDEAETEKDDQQMIDSRVDDSSSHENNEELHFEEMEGLPVKEEEEAVTQNDSPRNAN